MSVLDRTNVIKGLGEALILLAEYVPGERYLGYAPGACLDAIALLKAQEPVEANCEHRCNKCKFYEGVHNVMGHAPCSLWKISGVMWNDYCSRFNLWKESEV